MVNTLHVMPLDQMQNVTGKVIVTMQGNDFIGDLDFFGLTMATPERDVINRMSPVIEEQFGVLIRGAYKVRKALNSANIYIIPNSVAG